jgi:hypothetical protein
MFSNPLVRKWLPILLATLGVAVIALAVMSRGDSDDAALDSAVEQVIPGPGDQVLVQNPIGIDLVDGEPYEIRLSINGLEIPAREFVVSEALNRATYQPGDGQTLKNLESGDNCVVAEYWLVRQGPESARLTRWCFTAI